MERSARPKKQQGPVREPEGVQDVGSGRLAAEEPANGGERAGK